MIYPFSLQQFVKPAIKVAPLHVFKKATDSRLVHAPTVEVFALLSAACAAWPA